MYTVYKYIGTYTQCHIIYNYIYTCIPVKPGTQYTRYRPLPVAEKTVKMLPVNGHR